VYEFPGGAERVELHRPVAARDDADRQRRDRARLEVGLVPAVGVGRDAVAESPAEELPDGHAERLADEIPRSDVERVLAALDIFVLSSVSEGLSNTILEAMASGVPVVATRVGGAEESVEEGRTGILVPASDPDELAAALAALAADQERRAQFGAAGRLKAEREFSLDAMTAAYTDFYTALVTGRHRGDERLAEQPCAG